MVGGASRAIRPPYPRLHGPYRLQSGHDVRNQLRPGRLRERAHTRGSIHRRADRAFRYEPSGAVNGPQCRAIRFGDDCFMVLETALASYFTVLKMPTGRPG